MKQFILSVFTLSLFSCNSEKLPEFTTIDKIRIIALELNNPEVNPGDNVTVTPWVSDINETVGLTDSVSVCLDPGIAFGAAPTCEGTSSKVDIRINQPITITGNNHTGSADTFNINIPADNIIFSGRSDQERWNGVNYLIQYRLKNSAGTEITAIRRIVVSDPTKIPKNVNPVVSAILSDGIPMVALPVGGKVQLSTDITLASQESFQSKNTDGSYVTESEQVAVTWMTTDGETKYARSEIGATTEYTGPGTAPAGRMAHIFAVARDNRGGVKVLKVQF